MKTTRSAILSFCALFGAPSSFVNASVLTMGTPSCDGDFYLTTANINCDGKCAFGSDVVVVGELYADYALPSKKEHVLLESCWAGICSTIKDEDIGICDSDVLQPLDGQECGERGTYSFVISMTIPGSNANYFGGYTLDVTATFDGYKSDNRFSSTTCTLNVHASRGYQSMYLAGSSMLGLALLGGGMYCYRRRRQRLLSTMEQKVGGDEFAGNTHYVEMAEGRSMISTF